MGTLVHSFSQHKADVLSLTVTNNGVIPDASAAATEGGDGAGEGSSKRRPRSLRVFSAGVDGLVAAVRRVAAADGGPCRWVKAGGHHAHTHDVLSVAVSASGVVASGGLDSQLCVVDTTDVGQRQPRKCVTHAVSHPPTREPALAGAAAYASLLPVLVLSRFGPFPPWKLITAAMTPRLMMVQQPSQLDVWGLKRLPQTGSGAGAGAGAGSATNGGTIVASRRGSYKNKAQQPEELLLTLHAQVRLWWCDTASVAPVEVPAHPVCWSDHLPRCVVDQGTEPILASALSPDGAFLAVSDVVANTDTLRVGGAHLFKEEDQVVDEKRMQDARAAANKSESPFLHRPKQGQLVRISRTVGERRTGDDYRQSVAGCFLQQLLFTCQLGCLIRSNGMAGRVAGLVVC